MPAPFDLPMLLFPRVSPCYNIFEILFLVRKGEIVNFPIFHCGYLPQQSPHLRRDTGHVDPVRSGPSVREYFTLAARLVRVLKISEFLI